MPYVLQFQNDLNWVSFVQWMEAFNQPGIEINPPRLTLLPHKKELRLDLKDAWDRELHFLRWKAPGIWQEVEDQSFICHFPVHKVVDYIRLYWKNLEELPPGANLLTLTFDPTKLSLRLSFKFPTFSASKNIPLTQTEPFPLANLALEMEIKWKFPGAIWKKLQEFNLSTFLTMNLFLDATRIGIFQSQEAFGVEKEIYYLQEHGGQMKARKHIPPFRWVQVVIPSRYLESTLRIPTGCEIELFLDTSSPLLCLVIETSTEKYIQTVAVEKILRHQNLVDASNLSLPSRHLTPEDPGEITL